MVARGWMSGTLLLILDREGEAQEEVEVVDYDGLVAEAKRVWRAVYGKTISFRMMLADGSKMGRARYGELASGDVVTLVVKGAEKEKEKGKGKEKGKEKAKDKGKRKGKDKERRKVKGKEEAESPEERIRRAFPEDMKLSSFEIVRTVGTGTFGRVLLARYAEKNGQVYAIKCLRKADILRQKQVRHVLSETRVMAEISHPFIVNMRWCFQDMRNIYMVLDYVVGGELFTYLGNLEKLSMEMTVFFAAEIILVLEYLHKNGIVYRDLKPENVLIAMDGHIRLADYGFAKKMEPRDSTFTVCGTVDYLAPEIIKKQGHGFGVDLWAIGVLIFEMLAGYPPFEDDSQIAICTRILDVDLDFPDEFDDVTIDVIEALIVEEEEDRLGVGEGGFDQLKRHPFFRSVDWEEAAAGRMQPLFVPAVSSVDDTSCFPIYDEVDITAMDDEDLAVDQSIFAEFCKPFDL